MLLKKSINNCKLDNAQNILKEFYKRFIIPLYIPILCLISLLLITLSKENMNYTKLRITTFSLGVLIIIFSETTIRMISEIFTNNFVILILPLLIFII